jgi:multicomponent Na+:H+ antiporter subunit B
MRYSVLALIALLGAFVVWASQDLPYRGDPGSPAAVHDSVAVYYIENAYLDARTPNMVTTVLADYRSFDTFGEAIVVVTAAIAALLILLRRRDEDEELVEGVPEGGPEGPGPEGPGGEAPGGTP